MICTCHFIPNESNLLAFLNLYFMYVSVLKMKEKNYIYWQFGLVNLQCQTITSHTGSMENMTQPVSLVGGVDSFFRRMLKGHK